MIQRHELRAGLLVIDKNKDGFGTVSNFNEQDGCLMILSIWSDNSWVYCPLNSLSLY